ncbi:MAG: hypothetical protein FJZ95_09205, partial [Chloroflexi bacterium]|nr:hypothetical protein [Chloroflexota bacterium]
GENFKQHRWWDLHWKRRTRTEMFNVLDDKMRAAGIVTLHNLVQDIIKEFGIDYFRQGLREIVERERRVLVNRIRSLAVPGIYQWLQFRRVEYKGTLGRLWPNSNKDWILHKVAELSVRSDGTLLTDMEGLTSEDEFYCNCYEPGVRSMAALGMWPMFAYTKTVNSSLLYITDWNLPPGCMFNPQNPWAATVSGNAEAGALAFIYHNTLSLAYFARGFLEETMPADPSGGGYGLAGTFHDGFQWGGGDMTLVTCWGQAATAYRDGFPASNCAPNPQSDQGEVEVAEFLQPTQLNIGRKLIPDFCGHGKFRGALEMGMMQLVNKPGHALVIATFCSTSGMGAAATGMCGGYPRANDVVIYAHDTNVREILESGGRLPRDFVEMMKWIKEGRLKAGSIETFNGSTPTVPCKDGDLFASTSGSRGGWGDVLERPYELVQEDLKYGWITPHCASTVYGVSIDGNGKVDTKESDVLRKLLRNRRKERSVDARDWWNQERRRVREKEWHADVGAMYADCCKYPKFRKQFYGMWHLPEEHKV